MRGEHGARRSVHTRIMPTTTFQHAPPLYLAVHHAPYTIYRCPFFIDIMASFPYSYPPKTASSEYNKRISSIDQSLFTQQTWSLLKSTSTVVRNSSK
jgi:hypothetical protein